MRTTTRNRRVLGLTAALTVASVWLVHGLYHKLLGGSPRQLAIVQSTPGLDGTAGEHALMAIGAAEVGLAVWVLCAWAPRLCAGTQTLALLTMNGIELTFARDLLIWPAGLIPVNLLFLGLAWVAAALHRPASLLARLRRHPVAVRARLRHCLTLTYAVPADLLRPLVPPRLELETLGGYGFVAAAFVQAESLRPAGFPEALGQNFFLAGYRIFAKCRLPDGRCLRGLLILRSDADSTRMVVAGNLLTHYNYHYCAGSIVADAPRGQWRVTARGSDGTGDVDIVASPSGAALPKGSPFRDLRQARRFAGPMPFTFDYEAQTDAIVAVRATRTNWTPSPVHIEQHRIGWFDRPLFRGCAPVLAAAFHVSDVDYRWHRGTMHGAAS